MWCKNTSDHILRFSSKWLRLRSTSTKHQFSSSSCIGNETVKSSSNTSVLLSRLKACIKQRNLKGGKIIHDEVTRSGEISNTFVANSLITMYSKCNSPGDARSVFQRIPQKDLASWNSLILGFAENSKEDQALDLFPLMDYQGFVPNTRTFVAGLKACTSLATKEDGKQVDGKLVKLVALEKGREVHSQAVRNACDSNIFVGNALINMYAKCGCLVEAGRVFKAMQTRDVVTWTSLLLGYAENGEGELALETFECMKLKGCSPDHLAFVAALNACITLAAKEESSKIDGRLVKFTSLEKGMSLHAQAVRSGYETEILIGNALVDMYAKCGSLVDSRRVFDRMQHHTVVSWTVLMLGYAANGESELALKLFPFMQGCAADSTTFVAAINACTDLAMKEEGSDQGLKLRCLETGMDLHSQAAKSGWDTNLFVGSTLVKFYVKCGSLEDACRAFMAMEFHDVVSWNALVQGFAESRQPELALELLSCMREVGGCLPDSATFAAALKACGGFAVLEAVKGVHAEICRSSSEEDHPGLSSCLVDVYSKCGSVIDAQRAFDSLASADSVAWTALLGGFSRRGEAQQVLKIFQRMREEAVKVDGVTFLCVLAACGHAGLVERGKKCLEVMSSSEFGDLRPEIEHYHCVIDLLGRANQLEEAVEMVKGMPFEANAVTWTILLDACKKWRNEAVGRIAFEALVKLDRARDSGGYLLMANLYGTCSQTN